MIRNDIKNIDSILMIISYNLLKNTIPVVTLPIKNTKEQVILLHGLWRSPRSMAKIARSLEEKGFRVFNPGYNSLLENYQDIVQLLDEKISDWLHVEHPVHFVGHSFGGILIRSLLDKNPTWNSGRCVMIGTPNKGTKIASFMLSHWWYKYFVPRVTADLTPESDLIKQLPEPNIETGIIAGNVKYHIVIPTSWYYKRATDDAPGDGVVELTNVKCDSMADFIIMPLHHSFMTRDKDLIIQAVHFIENGRFTEEYQAVDASTV